MLVAILSSLEPAREGAACPRAFLQVAGRTVLDWQAQVALELGCERIVCLTQTISPQVIALQHRVERAGHRFHTIRDRLGLAALVTAADDVLVLADGLLPLDREAVRGLAERRGILTLPAEQAVPAGFERIDRDRAWAGAMRCGGAEVEKLAELAEDVDLLSALMRIAIQTGRPLIAVGNPALAPDSWLILDNVAAARATGRRMVAQRTRPSPWSAPGRALVDRLLLLRGESLIGHPRTAQASLALLVTGLVLALVSAGAGWIGTALVLVALAGAAARTGEVVAGFRASGEQVPYRGGEAARAAIDAALVAVAALSASASLWTSRVYPMLLLVGLVRLAALMRSGPAGALADDRIALILLLAGAAAAGWLEPALQFLTLAVLAVLLLRGARSRLTRA